MYVSTDIEAASLLLPTLANRLSIHLRGNIGSCSLRSRLRFVYTLPHRRRRRRRRHRRHRHRTLLTSSPSGYRRYKAPVETRKGASSMRDVLKSYSLTISLSPSRQKTRIDSTGIHPQINPHTLVQGMEKRKYIRCIVIPRWFPFELDIPSGVSLSTKKCFLSRPRNCPAPAYAYLSVSRYQFLSYSWGLRRMCYVFGPFSLEVLISYIVGVRLWIELVEDIKVSNL